MAGKREARRKLDCSPTQIVTDTQNQVAIDSVKVQLQSKEALFQHIPSAQQKLVFAASAPDTLEGSSITSSVGDVRDWQVIVFQNDKAAGRLVRPQVDVNELPVDGAKSQAPVHSVALVYDLWQPVGIAVKRLQQEEHIAIPVDSDFETSQFRLQVIGKRQGSSFALPSVYSFSGSEASASVSQHLQRLDYIRSQHHKFSEAAGDTARSHPPLWSQQQYVFERGALSQHFALTFDTRGSIPCLKRFSLTLAVLQQALDVTSPPPALAASALSTVESSRNQHDFGVDISTAASEMAAAASTLGSANMTCQQDDLQGPKSKSKKPALQKGREPSTERRSAASKSTQEPIEQQDPNTLQQHCAQQQSGTCTSVHAAALTAHHSANTSSGQERVSGISAGGSDDPGNDDEAASDDNVSPDNHRQHGSGGSSGSGGGGGSGGDRDGPGDRGLPQAGHYEGSSKKQKARKEAQDTEAEAEAEGPDAEPASATAHESSSQDQDSLHNTFSSAPRHVTSPTHSTHSMPLHSNNAPHECSMGASLVHGLAGPLGSGFEAAHLCNGIPAEQLQPVSKPPQNHHQKAHHDAPYDLPVDAQPLQNGKRHVHVSHEVNGKIRNGYSSSASAASSDIVVALANGLVNGHTDAAMLDKLLEGGLLDKVMAEQAHHLPSLMGLSPAGVVTAAAPALAPRVPPMKLDPDKLAGAKPQTSWDAMPLHGSQIAKYPPATGRLQGFASAPLLSDLGHGHGHGPISPHELDPSTGSDAEIEDWHRPGGSHGAAPGMGNGNSSHDASWEVGSDGSDPDASSNIMQSGPHQRSSWAHAQRHTWSQPVPGQSGASAGARRSGGAGGRGAGSSYGYSSAGSYKQYAPRSGSSGGAAAGHQQGHYPGSSAHGHYSGSSGQQGGYYSGSSRHSASTGRYSSDTGASHNDVHRPPSRPPSRGPSAGRLEHDANQHAATDSGSTCPTQEPTASTDLERFLLQVTPMLALDASKPLDQALQELCLEDVWRFYFEPSIYGREVYTLGGARGPSLCYFVPYLSAMQLFVPASPKDPGTNRLYISDTEGWPKHMHLKFEHFEKEMPFNRTPLYEHIEFLAASGSSGSAPPAPPPHPAAPAPAPAPAGPATTAGAAAGSMEATTAATVPAESDGADASSSSSSSSSSSDPQSPGRQASSDAVPAAKDAASSAPTPAAPAAPAHDASAEPRTAAAAAGSSPAAAAASASSSSGISKTGHFLHDTKISELHPASWFAVAWYPVYRIPDAPLCARFLTFHSFAPLVISMQHAHAALEKGQHRPVAIMPLQVVGLKWYNLQGERWLDALTEPSSSCSGRGGAQDDARKHPPSASDVAWQQHLRDLQGTAERLARGYGLRLLGQMGAEEVRQRHPDFEFFNQRG